MCGRFYIPPEDDDTGFQVILDQIQSACQGSPFLHEMKVGEIFPTDIVPVVTGKTPMLMKWGFPRYDGKGQIINARLETAEERPLFRKAYETQRCLIPAGHYFEWRKDGASKQKYAIGIGRPIYMAGLYKHEPGLPLPLFVILTRPAAPSLAFIHDRMPVIVPDHIRGKWLTECIGSQALLSASDENMSYWKAG